jgi:hypothetical protein
MQRTGQFIGGKWVGKVELLPGEFEVLSRPSKLGGRPGRLLLTNQRLIWRPSFRLKAKETDMTLIAHERVVACDVVRPWQRLFLSSALRVKLRGGETLLLYVRDAESILPTVREHLSRARYKPGDLFS